MLRSIVDEIALFSQSTSCSARQIAAESGLPSAASRKHKGPSRVRHRLEKAPQYDKRQDHEPLPFMRRNG